MESKFFKEIEKIMNVKTINDFQKELRTKIRDKFEIEKQIPILQEFYLSVSLNYGRILEMGDIGGLK